MALGPDLSDADLTQTELVSENWTVSWGDLLTGLVAWVATAFFGSIADTVGMLWEQVLIRPLEALGHLLDEAVNRLTDLMMDSMMWGQATDLVEDLGLVGGVIVIGGGLVLLALVVRWIRR